MGGRAGRMSGVFFAAITAASFAAASTSPFSTSLRRMRRMVAGCIFRRAVAIAIRSVFSFAPTSTIFIARASPSPDRRRGRLRQVVQPRRPDPPGPTETRIRLSLIPARGPLLRRHPPRLAWPRASPAW